MPVAVLEDFVEQMPRIQAAESLQRYQEVLVGAGNLKSGQARRIITAWRRQARIRHRPQNLIRARTPEEHRALLSSVGIGIA